MLMLFFTALFALSIFLTLITNLFPVPQITSCSIDDVLEAQLLPANSFALTEFGSFKPATQVLIPVKYDTGIYSESVTRKGDNLYQFDSVNL